LDESAAANMKVEPLLGVWSHLIMDWRAWEDEEDESAFDAIEEAVALQVHRSALFLNSGSEIAMMISLFVICISPVLVVARSALATI